MTQAKYLVEESGDEILRTGFHELNHKGTNQYNSAHSSEIFIIVKEKHVLYPMYLSNKIPDLYYPTDVKRWTEQNTRTSIKITQIRILFSLAGDLRISYNRYTVSGILFQLSMTL